MVSVMEGFPSNNMLQNSLMQLVDEADKDMPDILSKYACLYNSQSSPETKIEN